MNKARRKEMEKAIGFMEEAKAILETIAGEEQEAFDNMSEGLQNGDRGQQIQTNAERLQEAADAMDEYVNNLSEVEGG